MAPVMMNHVLRSDPSMLAEFRERVLRRDWAGARRLALALGLLNQDLPADTETTQEFFTRLAMRFAA